MTPKKWGAYMKHQSDRFYGRLSGYIPSNLGRSMRGLDLTTYLVIVVYTN